MKDSYDVIIIGAGPAGLSCAVGLQQSGKTVLVLDKKKEIGPKICAGGLTAKIKSLGLSLNKADVLFCAVKLNSPGRRKTITSNEPFVATIDRKKLAKILLEKLSDKIEIKTNTQVDKIKDDVIEINNKKIKYKYLIGADGSNSIVRRYLGLEIKKSLIALQYIIPEKFNQMEIFLDAYLFGSGYGWIFPHKNYTSVGCTNDINFMKSSELKDNFEKWLKSKNIKTKGYRLQGWTINYDYQGFDFGNKFLIGDAAGFASGLNGEGIYFGMVSGREVAKKIVNPSYNCKEISKILATKNKQEKIQKFTRLLNKPILNLSFRILLLLFNSKRFTKKALELLYY